MRRSAVAAVAACFAVVSAAGAMSAQAAVGRAPATVPQSAEAQAAEVALRSAGMPRSMPTVRQDSDIVNDEIVVSVLDPRGLPVDSKLISRISSRPGPERTVKDPTSVTNITYLNQRGRPTVDPKGDGIEVTVGGPEGTTILTESLVDKPLPVAMHAEYRLNGEVVDPEVIVGASGDIEIKYQVTNTDVKEEELTYKNAVGRPTTEKQPVFAPFVGTLSASVPDNIQVTDTKGAVVTTDKSGNTVLLWNLVLYPPMGDFEQKVSFTGVTDSGTVPAVALNVVPVDASSDPSLKFTTDLFEQTVKGNKQLASGLEQLNTQTAKLADAAGQLAAGIGQLADGTGAISAGVNSQLVPGSAQLAFGAGQLADGQAQLSQALGGAASGAEQLASGSQQLTSGLEQLADGLDQFSGNYPQLTTGAERIRKGAQALSDVVGSPDDKPLPSPSPTVPSGPTPIPTPSGKPVFPTPSPTATPTKLPTLLQAVDAATDGAQQLADQAVILNNKLVEALGVLSEASTTSSRVSADTASALSAAESAYAVLCAAPATPGCADLQQAISDMTDADAGSADVDADLAAATAQFSAQAVRAYALAQGSHELADAMVLIRQGVKAVAVALSTGTETPPGLVEAMGQLVDGLQQGETAISQLSSGAGQAASGSEQVTSGTDQLAGGLGQAATGADQLATGTSQLAQGAEALAFGSSEVGAALEQLTSGADQAASGTSQLATGADMLQRQGTAKIYRSVVKSSDQPALAASFLKASAARAGTALPYGLPKGATGSVAYVMTMDAVAPSGSVPWQFAAMGLVLLAGAGGAVAKNWAATRT